MKFLKLHMAGSIYFLNPAKITYLQAAHQNCFDNWEKSGRRGPKPPSTMIYLDHRDQDGNIHMVCADEPCEQILEMLL